MFDNFIFGVIVEFLFTLANVLSFETKIKFCVNERLVSPKAIPLSGFHCINKNQNEICEVIIVFKSTFQKKCTYIYFNELNRE
jgi:hypothetical protein